MKKDKKKMPIKGTEPIKANENERQALQKIEEVLNRKPLLSQSDNSSLPRLVGPNDETLEIPMSVFQVLQQAVNYMMHGKALSVIPCDQLLSIQETADILSISRSSLERLLEAGKLPFVEVGTQRRVQLSDVLEYKKQRSQQRRDSLAEMLSISQEAGEY